ncbi:MAG: hypothetical protein BJ554DRAFT_5592 [Olpidium bornovanus]|uniref:SH3 domain-containing protein n=1 Tax=Olpidium bornovanus TaxID=278681 RepID=A0A8H8DLD3_9FUNG|nr:MAG: hypothetical protein BJ554DRAFT_5592 [Olpidium bornovanus]
MLRAMVAHGGTAVDELSLEEGELVALLERRDDVGWWRGVNRDFTQKNGTQGWFPASCVEVEGEGYTVPVAPAELASVPFPTVALGAPPPPPPLAIQNEILASPAEELPSPSEDLSATVPAGTKVTSRYSYIAEKADELQFYAGATIIVVAAPEGGWWRGIVDADTKEPKQGWFPASFVVLDRSAEPKIEPAAEPEPPSEGKCKDEAIEKKRGGSAWLKRFVKKSSLSNAEPRSVPSSPVTNRVSFAGVPERKRSSSSPSRIRPQSATVSPVISGGKLTSNSPESELATDDAGRKQEAIKSPKSEKQPLLSTVLAKRLSTPVLPLPENGGRVGVRAALQRSLSVGPQRLSTVTSDDKAAAVLSPQAPISESINRITVYESEELKSIAHYKQQAWCDGLPDERIKFLKPAERQRQTVIWEVLVTEKDYLRDLLIIMDVRRSMEYFLRIREDCQRFLTRTCCYLIPGKMSSCFKSRSSTGKYSRPNKLKSFSQTYLNL